MHFIACWESTEKRPAKTQIIEDYVDFLAHLAPAAWPDYILSPMGSSAGIGVLWEAGYPELSNFGAGNIYTLRLSN